MKKELSNELLESVRQKKPARISEFFEPDVRRIREQYGLSQHKFASLMGIGFATLQNWEQGGGNPKGPRVFSSAPPANARIRYWMLQSM